MRHLLTKTVPIRFTACWRTADFQVFHQHTQPRTPHSSRPPHFNSQVARIDLHVSSNSANFKKCYVIRAEPTRSSGDHLIEKCISTLRRVTIDIETMFVKFSSTPNQLDKQESQSQTTGQPEIKQEQQTSTDKSEEEPSLSVNSGSPSGIMELKTKLLVKVSEPAASASNKVTVVGSGAVGMACAFSILTQVRIFTQTYRRNSTIRPRSQYDFFSFSVKVLIYTIVYPQLA